MVRGVEFLKGQIGNAVMAHRAFVQALEDHEGRAKDPRFRDLCVRFLPKALSHQRMLEEYRRTLGGDDGMAKKAAGMALGVARDLADVVREDDFLRLAGDIVLARQLEDTFKTFREAGRTLSLPELARLGEIGERDHDDYVKEANRLAQQIFVEQVRGDEDRIRAVEQPVAPA